MKKKRLIIIGVVAFLVIIAVGITMVSQSSKWSEKSFEAVIQEIVTQPDGEVRLIVERKTEIYGSPMNSLGISEDTNLLNANGSAISITDLEQGNFVRVTLKEAFTEETPFYYPTVYEIRIIDTDK